MNPSRRIAVRRLLRIHALAMLAMLLAGANMASAWTTGGWTASAAASQSAHFGGDRAPLEIAVGHLMAASVTDSGPRIWQSLDGGASWSSQPLDDPLAEQARLLSRSTAISWSRYRAPVIHVQQGAGWQPVPTSGVWPLSRAWLMDAIDLGGDVLFLATEAQPGRIVEGPLHAVRHVGGQWQASTLLSSASVGDARIVVHTSGLISVLWSERDASGWRIMMANSPDQGATWSTPIPVVSGILAPPAQESAVLLAAAALPGGDQLALAFTGWASQPHSQIWAKQVDAASGAGTGLTLLPDAGDMVYSPGIAVQSDGRWQVVWQQKLGIDMEVYLAERSPAGQWSGGINVSSDPLHLNYDAHVAGALSHAVNVAFTTTVVPGVAENYQIAMGAASDPALDSDGDGMPDAQEAGQDMDQDGVDDSLSAAVATWSHADGRYALILDGVGALARVQALDTQSAHVADPASYRRLSDMISFRIQGLMAGAEARVHLVTPHRLPADATWMKWNAAGLWEDVGVPVSLDAAGTGLHIVLTDGGIGDEDGMANGVIEDPGMLAAPQSGPSSAPSPAAGGGGGGCLLGMPAQAYPGMLLLLGVLLALMRLGRASACRSHSRP